MALYICWQSIKWKWLALKGDCHPLWNLYEFTGIDSTKTGTAWVLDHMTMYSMSGSQ